MDMPKRSRWTHFVSQSCILVWISFCKFVLLCICRVKHVYHDRMFRIIYKRSRDQPVITICNHVSFLDPPVLAALLPYRALLNIDRYIPHTIGAREIVHRNRAMAAWFKSVKCVPCDRGTGLEQPAMTFLTERLCQGDWVHVFPEGRINKTGERLEFKLGTAKLIAESKVVPLVIPMYFTGTEDVLPTRRPYYPRFGKNVTVLYGQPIEFSNEVKTILETKRTDVEALKRITKDLRDHMDVIELQAKEMHG